MKQQDEIESWRRARAAAPTPVGFADRVMGRVHALHQQRKLRALGGLLGALHTSRRGQIAICSVATLIYLFRLSQVVAMFIAR